MWTANKRCRYGMGVLAVVLCGGCQSSTFDHGEPPQSASEGFPTATGAGGTSGGFGPDPFEGNYPDPAVTRCGDVLGDLPAIRGLASGWAVVAVPGATADGAPVEAGSVLLRLSEQGIRNCGDVPRTSESFGSSGTGAPEGDDTSSGDAWEFGARGLELLLAPNELALGDYDIATLATPQVTAFGEDAATDPGGEASIELLRVDDDCIVGIVRGFVNEAGEPFMVGGFVAQTCQRQCIPVGGEAC